MGIEIDEHFILFSGTCKECLQKKSQKEQEESEKL